MKAEDIKVGGHYIAKVSNKLVTVRVTGIDYHPSAKSDKAFYHVINLSTGRRTTFRSAQKFRSEVKQYQGTASPLAKAVVGPMMDKLIEQGAIPPADFKIDKKEDEQRSDPTTSAKSAASQCHPSPTASKSPELEPSAASPAPVSEGKKCSDPTTSSAPSAASTSKTVGAEKPLTSPSSLASTIEHSKGDPMKDKPKLPPMTDFQKAHVAEAGASFFSAARCIISADMMQSLETIEDDVKFLCSTGITAESTRSDYIDFFVAVCKKVLEMLGEKNPQNPT